MAVGGVAYVATLFVLHRARIMQLRDMVRMLRSRRTPDSGALPSPAAAQPMGTA
jgi:hypothetical protein